jgi:hypothetical protein
MFSCVCIEWDTTKCCRKIPYALLANVKTSLKNVIVPAKEPNKKVLLFKWALVKFTNIRLA